ncbi:hypothetical protein FH972_024845 [Carpinus fangiana]|uniref:Uncharacterized protein n=1 Tax=Carpinus fangiana TaxID=176857 RepID=A0A5N6KZW4_9ROSI|nr:hypothetical protein FH972_024845 [Carpinus fangiana]
MANTSNETLAAALCGILLGICVLVSILGGMRWYRLRTKNSNSNILPMHVDEKLDSSSSDGRQSSTLTITTSVSSRRQSQSKAIYVTGGSKDQTSTPPQSPLPEIRITFPEEIDGSGKRQSGRCVVVRISEHGSEGFEPYDEQLPSYQLDANDRFQSLDLERIGGLKEKTINKTMAAV